MSCDLPPLTATDEVAGFSRTCTQTVNGMERAGEIEAIPGLHRVKHNRREIALTLLDDEEK